MSQLNWLPESLLERVQTRELAADQFLFHRGDPVFGIFIVNTGQIRMVRHTVEGSAVVINTAVAGELFAEAALFSDSYHCDAVAAKPSTVSIYDKKMLLSSLRDNPDLAENFMALMAGQVQRLRTRLEQRNIRSARERLMHHLLLSVGDDGRTVPLTGTLKELATELGLTHEALYRTIAQLEKDGIVERTASALILVPRKVV